MKKKKNITRQKATRKRTGDMNNTLSTHIAYLEGYKNCIKHMEQALSLGANLETTIKAAKVAYQKTQEEFVCG